MVLFHFLIEKGAVAKVYILGLNPHPRPFSHGERGAISYIKIIPLPL
jgi:hypothetical protein